MAGTRIAVYLRLSQEDVDLKHNALKDESNSIHSQRQMAETFIREHPDLTGRPVSVFIDDGYTGTNFDRPQFQAMLAQIRTGEIGCIIVKDLSRFGRNYLEVGDYLEHLFPFLDVRFISINDHYDSASYIGTTGGVDVVFRNLVYQQYSQDLSQKVKTTMHRKMSKGRYVTHCPYGYRKAPGVKHQMIPDPETAPVVQEIFHMAIAGKRSIEIAAILNDRRIPTPMEQKQLSRERMQNDAMWSHQAVLRILRDYKYTGAMVNFKRGSQTIRDKVQKRYAPEEWVVVENSHEPIVSHEEFEAANASIRRVKPHGTTRHPQTDRVYYCGHCGRRLRKTFGLDEYYSCATALYRKDAPCAEIRWSRTELESIVLTAFRAQLSLMEEQFHKASSQHEPSPAKKNRQAQKRVSRELSAMAQQNLHLYERYKAGEFDAETFLSKKAELQSLKSQVESELAALRSEEDRLASEQQRTEQQAQQLQAAKDLLHLPDKQLAEEMYAFLDRVIISCNREIEIRWKLDDCFQPQETQHNVS